MNSTKTETIAISEVERCFEKCDKIITGLSKNDKTIAWDGYLYLYNDVECTKDLLYGKIPVQVKGRVKKGCNDEISFSVKKSDIKAYKDDGVAFFVVYIDYNDDLKTVYYVLLAPIDIKGLLENCDNKKTISLRLNKWCYTNDGDVIRDLKLFYDDCKRQKSFVDTQTISLDDLKQIDKPKFKVFSIIKKGDNLSRALVNRKAYLYTNIGDANRECLIPVGTGRYSFVITETINNKVVVGDKVFFENYTITRNKDNDIITIGKCLKLTLPVEDGGEDIQISISYNVNNYCLSESINELDFIFSLIQEKKLIIGDKELNFSEMIEQDKIALAGFNELRGLYNRLVKLKKALLYLNVGDELDLKLIKSKNDEMLINVLITSFVDHQDIYNPQKFGDVSEIELGNIKVLVAATKTGNNKYHIEDYFHCRLKVTGKYRDGTEGVLPPCSILDKDKFLKYSNIDYDDILPSFKEFHVDNSNYYYLANVIVLNLLLAYDEQRIKDERKINTAMDLTDWLINTDADEKNRSIYILNKLQIKKRKNYMDDVDKNYLYDLIDKSQSDEIKFAAYLLLDEKPLALRAFNKLSEQQQTTFKTMPIYNFVKEF